MLNRPLENNVEAPLPPGEVRVRALDREIRRNHRHVADSSLPTSGRASWFLRVLLVGLCAVSIVSYADVPKPKIPKGKGERCVEDTNVMRKNHMEFLLHQRDETVHKGIRTKKHSLKECLNCHAVNDENNMPVGNDDKRHFCNSCHIYAAVSIDCFECHQSKPDAPKVSGMSP